MMNKDSGHSLVESLMIRIQARKGLWSDVCTSLLQHATLVLYQYAHRVSSTLFEYDLHNINVPVDKSILVGSL
jgi:hypothetical protein